MGLHNMLSWWRFVHDCISSGEWPSNWCRLGLGSEYVTLMSIGLWLLFFCTGGNESHTSATRARANHGVYKSDWRHAIIHSSSRRFPSQKLAEGFFISLLIEAYRFHYIDEQHGNCHTGSFDFCCGMGWGAARGWGGGSILKFVVKN